MIADATQAAKNGKEWLSSIYLGELSVSTRFVDVGEGGRIIKSQYCGGRKSQTAVTLQMEEEGHAGNVGRKLTLSKQSWMNLSLLFISLLVVWWCQKLWVCFLWLI